MAFIVDLGEPDSEAQKQGAEPLRNRTMDAAPVPNIRLIGDGLPGQRPAVNGHNNTHPDADADTNGHAVRENPNNNAMTRALGCYP
jgi:hypothetical protein